MVNRQQQQQLPDCQLARLPDGSVAHTPRGAANANDNANYQHNCWQTTPPHPLPPSPLDNINKQATRATWNVKHVIQ